MRLYFKDLIQRPKFLEFVKNQKDFLYTENNEAIFAPPRAIKDEIKIAFKMDTRGEFIIGKINDSCQNFETLPNKCCCYPEEISWITEKLEMVKKYSASKRRKNGTKTN